MLQANRFTAVCQGSRFAVGRVLQAPPQRAWELLTDTAAWPQWGPTVRRVASPARFIRRGSRGKVLTPIGLWLPFIVTAYEHGRYWDWRVAGVRATGHRLVALDADRCRIIFELPLLWLPYFFVCRRALANLERLLLSECPKNP